MAEAFDRLCDEAVYIGDHADIGADGVDVETFCAELRDRCCEAVLVDIGEHDRRAFLGKAARAGEADAACGAGDNGGLALETHGVWSCQ